MTKEQLEQVEYQGQVWERIYGVGGESHEAIVRSGRSFQRADGTRIAGSYGGRDYVLIGHHNSNVGDIARQMEVGGYTYYIRIA